MMDLASRAPSAPPIQIATPSSLSFAFYTSPAFHELNTSHFPPNMTVASQTPEILPILRPSASKLDSLVSFYQRERVWVDQTRAEFQLQDEDESESADSPPSPPPLVAEKDAVTSDSPSIPHDEGSPRPTCKSLSPRPSSSKWTRRKKGFELNANLPHATKSARTHMSAEAARPVIRVLDMYESIMQSRMESCERINRLIRTANRSQIPRVTKRYAVERSHVLSDHTNSSDDSA